jgi:penicillin amidase
MGTDFNRVIQQLCGAALCATLLTQSATAREKENPLESVRQVKTSVAGLKSPAQILVDVWGIPHIYADNEHDVLPARF